MAGTTGRALTKVCFLLIVAAIGSFGQFRVSGRYGDSDFIPSSQGKAASNEKTKKANEKNSKDQRSVQYSNVLWKEPVDIETRDLFYGIGGKEGAPDLSGHFKYIQPKLTGTQKKIIVKDDKGRQWVVKFGPEAKPETSATRIIWAVGYHTDQDYFVKAVHIDGYSETLVNNVRFKRDNDGFKTVGHWGWNSNPFVGTQELEGLKALMALINNFDLKKSNNKIVRPKKKSGAPDEEIYYAHDLGAAFGTSGNSAFGNVPLIGEFATGTKGDAKGYAGETFVQGVKDGKVHFRMKRNRAGRALGNIRMESARWMGNLLGRLSDKQLGDAFRASGFDEAEISILVNTLKS